MCGKHTRIQGLSYALRSPMFREPSPPFMLSGGGAAHITEAVAGAANGELQMSLKDTILGAGFARFKDRRFLEASMAASALVAMADAHVHLSEQLAVDRVLENIERLNVFDPRKAIDLHRQFVQAMRANSGEGQDWALEVIGRFRGNEEAADLLIRIARYTAQADQHLSGSELMAIRRLCRELGVDPEPYMEDVDPD